MNFIFDGGFDKGRHTCSACHREFVVILEPKYSDLSQVRDGEVEVCPFCGEDVEEEVGE